MKIRGQSMLEFNDDGRLVKIDDEVLVRSDDGKLIRSNDLKFLSEEKVNDVSKDRLYWSLYNSKGFLDPLKFSNDKTQEDVVKEIVDLIKDGKKVVFLRGVCGSGKSAIALNIARVLGRASIVVPIKSLQKQYEQDYTGEKYLVRNKRKMKIAMITGRANHDSIIEPGKSCADVSLPDTIQIIEKNKWKLEEYYMNNPFIKNKDFDLKKLKRISIAPANPYWSPILPGNFELQMRDADKKRYEGLRGKDFIFYHRKRGCSYYDQYQAYLDSDVIIFNSAKYLIESALDRKPCTDVEIIDEADEFLDNFANQEDINLTRLVKSLNLMDIEEESTKEEIENIKGLIDLEEKNKRALGINENEILKLKDTRIDKILKILLKNPEIGYELNLDEGNYVGKVFEVAKEFEDFMEDSYVSFKRKDGDLIVNLISVDLSNKFKELVDKNKALVLMSGTIHSEKVLKHIFGIKDYKVVDAETINQGSMDIIKTGKEFDCKYFNFSSKKHSRKEYLEALNESVKRAKPPVLIHVNAFEDLPSSEELTEYKLDFLMNREKLLDLQANDRAGEIIQRFKKKQMECLFTTKCSRGVDFPGDTCNSIVFTKYPNPNVRNIFWRILKENHSDYYWEFYMDRAWRDFLQKIYRAIRSKEDHVNILSPDSRVLDAVRKLQEGKS